MTNLKSKTTETRGFLRATDAAAFIGLSPSTLAKMRLRGDGPPFSKAGPRAVIYAVSDLEQWANQHKRTSTSDRGAA